MRSPALTVVGAAPVVIPFAGTPQGDQSCGVMGATLFSAGTSQSDLSRGAMGSGSAAAAASTATPFVETPRGDPSRGATGLVFAATPEVFPFPFLGDSSGRYSSARRKIRESSSPRASGSSTNTDYTNYYARVFESFFYARDEETGKFNFARTAVQNFMEQRKKASKCASAPTVLFTVIKVQDHVRGQDEDQEFCLVSISGVLFKQDTSESPLSVAERNGLSFWREMYKFLELISKKTDLKYVLVGVYDPNHYHLIQTISEEVLNKSLDPIDETKQCAERATDYLLSLLTNQFPNSLKKLDSQAFKLDPKGSSLTAKDACEVCKLHFEPVRVMLEATRSLSRNSAAAPAAAASAAPEERRPSPIELGSLVGRQPWPESFNNLISCGEPVANAAVVAANLSRGEVVCTPVATSYGNDQLLQGRTISFADLNRSNIELNRSEVRVSSDVRLFRPSPKQPTPKSSPQKILAAEALAAAPPAPPAPLWGPVDGVSSEVQEMARSFSA